MHARFLLAGGDTSRFVEPEHWVFDCVAPALSPAIEKLPAYRLSEVIVMVPTSRVHGRRAPRPAPGRVDLQAQAILSPGSGSQCVCRLLPNVQV